MIIDGMADRPLENREQNPFRAAETPNMDRMAQLGIKWNYGLHKTRNKTRE